MCLLISTKNDMKTIPVKGVSWYGSSLGFGIQSQTMWPNGKGALRLFSLKQTLPSCHSPPPVSLMPLCLCQSLTAEKYLILFKQDQLAAGDPGSSNVEVAMSFPSSLARLIRVDFTP